MEGPKAPPPASAAPAAGSSWLDLRLLLVLLLLATGLRAWLLCHTEVAARDSIGFIRLAWQFEHQPWLGVLRQAEQHPGYPLAVLAMSLPVRAVLGSADAHALQLSAQLASALAGVLLVLPMYYLGRELFSRGVAFGACALFQCLPAAGRVLSDGLSEATFLLFAAAALLFAVRALRSHSRPYFALCGLCGGLAYLTRPEGALIVGFTGLVLLALQWSLQRRRSWRHALSCAAALSVAFAAVGGPLVAVTGRVTIKPSGQMILDAAMPEVHDEPEPGKVELVREPVLASTWGVFLSEEDGSAQLWAGLKAVSWEVIQGFHYVVWVPVLLGLWWFRARVAAAPGAWVLLLVSVAILGLLWRVASTLGYVSDRHLLLPILCACFWAAAGVSVVSRWLVTVLTPRLPGWLPAETGVRLGTGLLLAALVVPAVPKALEPLHANRGGFREAGGWLAEHATPADKIIDPYAWANFYAGRVFQEGPQPTEGPGVLYVVYEQSHSKHERLPQAPLAKQLADQGKMVWEKTRKYGHERALVQIYVLPLPPARQ